MNQLKLIVITIVASCLFVGCNPKNASEHLSADVWRKPIRQTGLISLILFWSRARHIKQKAYTGFVFRINWYSQEINFLQYLIVFFRRKLETDIGETDIWFNIRQLNDMKRPWSKFFLKQEDNYLGVLCIGVLNEKTNSIIRKLHLVNLKINTWNLLRY